MLLNSNAHGESPNVFTHRTPRGDRYFRELWFET